MPFRIDINVPEARSQWERTVRHLFEFDVSSAMGEVGEEILSHLEQGFDSRTDPYGAGWAAVKTPNQGIGRILMETGTMRGTLAYVASSSQVEVGVNTPYAKYHQYGTSKMAQRKIVPDSGLPGELEPKIRQIFERLVRG